MAFSSTHAFWVNGVSNVVKFDLTQWTIEYSTLPMPFLSVTGLPKAIVFQNSTSTILALAAGTGAIFLDVRQMSNIKILNSMAVPDFGKNLKNKKNWKKKKKKIKK